MSGMADDKHTVVTVAATGLIYKNGQSVPSDNWSFEMAIKADESLLTVTVRLKNGFGILERCRDLAIKNYRVRISNKDTKTSAEFPRGRLYSTDTEEQWITVLPDILSQRRSLVGKFFHIPIHVSDLISW